MRAPGRRARATRLPRSFPVRRSRARQGDQALELFDPAEPDQADVAPRRPRPKRWDDAAFVEQGGVVVGVVSFPPTLVVARPQGEHPDAVGGELAPEPAVGDGDARGRRYRAAGVPARLGGARAPRGHSVTPPAPMRPPGRKGRHPWPARAARPRGRYSVGRDLPSAPIVTTEAATKTHWPWPLQRRCRRKPHRSAPQARGSTVTWSGSSSGRPPEAIGARLLGPRRSQLLTRWLSAVRPASAPSGRSPHPRRRASRSRRSGGPGLPAGCRSGAGHRRQQGRG